MWGAGTWRSFGSSCGTTTRIRTRSRPWTLATLHDRIRKEAVIVLDVRPGDEYAAGHIPGAVSLPIAELEQRLSELSRNREIVAYCRGPYCLFSRKAVEKLRAHGFRALRMEHGVVDWHALGFPVATGPGSDR
jgi:rhodanese-related sulfurtransferase